MSVRPRPPATESGEVLESPEGPPLTTQPADVDRPQFEPNFRPGAWVGGVLLLIALVFGYSLSAILPPPRSANAVVVVALGWPELIGLTVLAIALAFLLRHYGQLRRLEKSRPYPLADTDAFEADRFLREIQSETQADTQAEKLLGIDRPNETSPPIASAQAPVLDQELDQVVDQVLDQELAQAAAQDSDEEPTQIPTAEDRSPAPPPRSPLPSTVPPETTIPAWEPDPQRLPYTAPYTIYDLTAQIHAGERSSSGMRCEPGGEPGSEAVGQPVSQAPSDDGPTINTIKLDPLLVQNLKLEGLDAVNPDMVAIHCPPTEPSLRILVVDDNPAGLKELTDRLGQGSYAIVQVATSDEALRIVAAGFLPDLVFLDAMLSHATGYEVGRKIGEQFPSAEMPLVVLLDRDRVANVLDGLDPAVLQSGKFSKNEILSQIKAHLALSNLSVSYGRFVPREFLKLLDKNSIVDVALGDRVQRYMSVLFADIRGFTSLSEQMTPEDNLNFINAYLSRMEAAIGDNAGFIDKYIGDAIMALFEGAADDALQAAIAMLATLEGYNRTRSRPGRQPIRIGIGIDIGPLMLGTVGGVRRMETTAIGDAVNLASRLEELTKQYSVSILVSHRVVAALQEPSRYMIRFIDRLQVRGRSAPVAVYEVLNADPPELRKLKQSTASRFDEGVLMFHCRRYAEAADRFEECLRAYPGDRAAQIYLERSVRAGFPPSEQAWQLIKGKVVRKRRRYQPPGAGSEILALNSSANPKPNPPPASMSTPAKPNVSPKPSPPEPVDLESPEPDLP